MKVYISADIEGVAGIAHASEANPSAVESAGFRAQMTEEVAAACEAAFSAGAHEILVKDAHGPGRNLDPSRLKSPADRSLRIIRGWSGHPYGMVEGIDQSFSQAIFIGFHSAAGSAGHPLAHTISGRLFSRVQLNGMMASEFLLYSTAAASVGVPVTFVSGDQALCEEARSCVEGIRTVATGQGIGHAIYALSPAEVVRQIRENVLESLTHAAARPRPMPASFVLQIEYHRPPDAYSMSFYPGVRLISERELEFRSADYLAVLAFLRTASRMP